MDIVQPVADWISAATLTEDGVRARLTLPDREGLQSPLENLVLSLTGDTRERESSEMLLRRFLMLAREIASGQREHPLSARIKTTIDYYNIHVQRINGVGLWAVLEPFDLPCLAAEAEAILVACARETIQHIGGTLAENRFLPMLGRGEAPAGRVVVVNGLHRTGSTRVFLAAQAVLAAVETPYRTASCDFANVDRLISHVEWGAGKGGWLLIKSHRWMPNRSASLPIVFYTRRRIADVVASSLALGQSRGEANPEAKLIGYISMAKLIDEYCAPRYDLHVVDYDEYADRDADLIRYVASKMNIDIPEPKIPDAAEFISAARVRRVSEGMVSDDPSTFIQRKHVSDTLGKPMARLDSLPPAIVQALKAYGEWPLADDL